MRPFHSIVSLALVLAALGAGLSFSGYNEGVQIVTSTSTLSYTTTLTSTIVFTSAESFLTRTRTTNDLRNWIPLSRTLQSAGPKYCYYDSRLLELEKGQAQASVDGATFWILSPEEYAVWMKMGNCEDAALFKGGLKISSSGLVEVPASGSYYLVFLTQTQSPSFPLMFLNVHSTWEGVITTTIQHTIRSARETAFPTASITYNVQPAGFGLIFYLGTGLAAIAGMALAISGIGAKRASARQLTTPIAPPPLPHEPNCQCDLHRLPLYEKKEEKSER